MILCGGRILPGIVTHTQSVPYDWSKDVKNIKVPIFMAIGDAVACGMSMHSNCFAPKAAEKWVIYTGRRWLFYPALPM
jgi:hypothetical protein